MKKGLLLVGALVAFTFASCKKDYVCSCTGSFAYKYTMTESKKKAAQAVCEGKGIGPITVDGVVVPEDNTTTCVIE